MYVFGILVGKSGSYDIPRLVRTRGHEHLNLPHIR